jgi:uncharacterized protein (TIGR02444 family)
MALPSHPFWKYSLALYAQPGVSGDCLMLQDEYGLDVNLVLFSIWAGAEGPGELTEVELSECVARAGQWQTEVVVPIRRIRRALKQDMLGATSELVHLYRPQVQRLELESEHVEQLLLVTLVPQSRGDTGKAVALKNTQRYLQQAGLDSDGGAKTAVERIIAQAFPG